MGTHQQPVGHNCAQSCLSPHLLRAFLLGAKGDFAQQSAGQTGVKAAAWEWGTRDLLMVGDGVRLGPGAMLVGAGGFILC